MFFFALFNLVLAFAYAILEPGVSHATLLILCGIALAFLFDTARTIKTPGTALFVIWSANLVACLLFYSLMTVGTSDHLRFLVLTLVIGTGFCALLAIVIYFVDKNKVASVIKCTAFCVTAVNSLPLISHLTK